MALGNLCTSFHSRPRIGWKDRAQAAVHAASDCVARAIRSSFAAHPSLLELEHRVAGLRPCPAGLKRREHWPAFSQRPPVGLLAEHGEQRVVVHALGRKREHVDGRLPRRGEVSPEGRPPRSAELYAAGRVIGFKCFDANFEFMKCKAKESHPTACEAQGTEVALHSADCYTHCNTETGGFSNQQTVAGVSLKQVVQSFVFGTDGPTQMLDNCTGTFACGAGCSLVSVDISPNTTSLTC